MAGKHKPVVDKALDIAALKAAAEVHGLRIAPADLKSALAGSNWLRECVARLRAARLN